MRCLFSGFDEIPNKDTGSLLILTQTLQKCNCCNGTEFKQIKTILSQSMSSTSSRVKCIWSANERTASSSLSGLIHQHAWIYTYTNIFILYTMWIAERAKPLQFLFSSIRRRSLSFSLFLRSLPFGFLFQSRDSHGLQHLPGACWWMVDRWAPSLFTSCPQYPIACGEAILSYV